MLYTVFLTAVVCAAIVGVMVLVYGLFGGCRTPSDFQRFRGLDGSVHTNPLRMSWLSEPGVSCPMRGRLRTRQEKTSEVFPNFRGLRLSFDAPPKGGFGLTPTEW